MYGTNLTVSISFRVHNKMFPYMNTFDTKHTSPCSGGKLVLVRSDKMQLMATGYCYCSAIKVYFDRSGFLGRGTEPKYLTVGRSF